MSKNPFDEYNKEEVPLINSQNHGININERDLMMENSGDQFKDDPKIIGNN